MIHTDLSRICGFAVVKGERYRIGNSAYCLRQKDVRTLNFLFEAYSVSKNANNVYWLLPLRKGIREMEHLQARAVLSRVVACTDNDRVRRLAIWLRGRCGGSVGVAKITRFAKSEDLALRREVARCFRRMKSWQLLEVMLATETDPRIQKICQAPTLNRPYADRLHSYTLRVKRKEVADTQTPLILSPEIDLSQSFGPKSATLIRRILKHIRQLVKSSR